MGDTLQYNCDEMLVFSLFVLLLILCDFIVIWNQNKKQSMTDNYMHSNKSFRCIVSSTDFGITPELKELIAISKQFIQLAKNGSLLLAVTSQILLSTNAGV